MIKFKYVILFSSILLALTSGWFSISGIAHLFEGAYYQTAIMALALELAKLVSISFLYRYWSQSIKAVKYYMLTGSLILSMITSVGVYGYLASAYAASALGFNYEKSKITAIVEQNTQITNNISFIRDRLARLQNARDKQETRLDSLVGKTGFTTQQRVVQQDAQEIQSLQKQLGIEHKQLDSLQKLRLVQDSTLQQTSKLTTFDYVANVFGISLDTLIKWFIFVIVFVFDPMSVALIISYNTIVAKEKIIPSPDTSPEIPISNKPDEPEEIAQETVENVNIADTRAAFPAK